MADVTVTPFKYTDTSTPTGYKCGECLKTGVKLWRRYQVFLEDQDLFCVDCAMNDQYKPGERDCTCEMFAWCKKCKKFDISKGDQIGWLIPAVPTEDGQTYWGYTSVPDGGVTWWKNLEMRRRE